MHFRQVQLMQFCHLKSTGLDQVEFILMIILLQHKHKISA